MVSIEVTPRHNDFGTATKSGKNVWHNRTSGDLEATLHYFSIDKYLGSITGGANIHTVCKGIMIINGKPR